MQDIQKLSGLGLAAIAALMLGLAGSPAMAQDMDMDNDRAMDNQTMMENDAELDRRVMATLDQCRQIAASCSQATQNAAGILVFPNVIKADLLIGGAGGKGALVENGRITGYYNIGAVTAGLQAGVEGASQVYVFRTPESLAQLKQGSDWKAGATANATLVTADATARGATDADVLAYVFDAKGLHAGISLDVFNVWRAGQQRPVDNIS